MTKQSILASYPGSVRISMRPAACKAYMVQIHSRGAWKAVKSFVHENDARALATTLSNAEHTSIGSIHTQQHRAAERAMRVHK